MSTEQKKDNVNQGKNKIRDDYDKKAWARCIDYINEMQSTHIYLPNSQGTIHSSSEWDLRIDMQNTFTDTVNQVIWYNLQVQENTQRKGVASTTVFTTYVHKEGYENWSEHLNSSTILKAMQQQAYHQMPMTSVFISQDRDNKKLISAQRVPRRPEGLRGFVIWRKPATTTVKSK